MVQNIRELLKIIILTVKGFMNGLIKGNMKVDGLIIKWKDREFSLGQMEGNIVECIRMIKRMDLGHLIGLMGENT